MTSTNEEPATEEKTRGPKFFVPEVIQTSAMDCGPATLKAVLGGFGIHINYDRLRERCQTDVDGTSVSAICDLGQQLGLNVESIMVPLDTLLMKDANSLPAIAITDEPGGYHFVVVWSAHGDYLQIMDPASGRSFVRKERFLERVASVTVPFGHEEWRDWAETGSDAQLPLAAKIKAIGGRDADVEALVQKATADAGWHTFGALDAAVRMVRTLVESKAIDRGRGAIALVDALVDDAVLALRTDSPSPIADQFWTVQEKINRDGDAVLLVTGAVIIFAESAVVQEQKEPAPRELTSMSAGIATRRLSLGMPTVVPGRRGSQFQSVSMPGSPGRVSRSSIWFGNVMPKSVVQALAESEVRPARLFWDMARLDFRAGAYVLFALTAIALCVGTLDILIMRGLSDILGKMSLPEQRVTIVVSVVVLFVLAFLIEAVRTQIAARIGRGLETRLRVSFLEKLPRLEDKYLRTRPLSDMASRAHLLQSLRGVPSLAVGLFSSTLSLLLTGGILVWLFPPGWWLVLITSAVVLALPLVAFRGLDEQFARLATHGGALFSFYLDSLLGVVPIRVHGAERVMRRQHEDLLTEWARAGYRLQRSMFLLHIVEGVIAGAVNIGLVYAFVRGGGSISKILVFVYFAQRLAAIGSSLVGGISAYPSMRHNALRLFEPLGAAETNVNVPPPQPRRDFVVGISIAFNGAEVVSSGRALLKNINVRIAAGSHVGIVGASGAGKSSFLSVLLGWLTLTEGRVTVDGIPLDAARLARLREETAWVDPSIQLWNANILENLMYGSDETAVARMHEALHLSDVVEVLERSPEGLLTSLGEGGARVSGGQGQRIRFGRALLKDNARLVLLDEPFRGLERDRRQLLLSRARTHWQNSTMLFVSHDVSDTLELDRVLVIDGGEIVEDGTPEQLMALPNSRYRALVEGDRRVRVQLWEETPWRRARIENGEFIETLSDDIEATQ